MTIEPRDPTPGANGLDDKIAPKVVISPLNGAKPGLSNEFYNVLNDIEYLVKDIAQLTGDDLAHTNLKIHEHIATARKIVESMGDTLTERAHNSVVATNNFIQDQPWKAIGIGATTGLVLGALLARRT